jgi:hypothetical protein
MYKVIILGLLLIAVTATRGEASDMAAMQSYGQSVDGIFGPKNAVKIHNKQNRQKKRRQKKQDKLIRLYGQKK